jgi:hypothetical protein
MEKSSSNSTSSKAQLDKAWADAYLKAEQQFARITKKYLRDSDGRPILQDKISPRDLVSQVQNRKKNLDKDRENHQSGRKFWKAFFYQSNGWEVLRPVLCQ